MAEAVTRCLEVADRRRRPGLIVEHARAPDARALTLDAASEAPTTQGTSVTAGHWIRHGATGGAHMLPSQTSSTRWPVPSPRSALWWCCAEMRAPSRSQLR
jgi:hypothetical protein